jgi:hypothetical protein
MILDIKRKLFNCGVYAMAFKCYKVSTALKLHRVASSWVSTPLRMKNIFVKAGVALFFCIIVSCAKADDQNTPKLPVEKFDTAMPVNGENSGKIIEGRYLSDKDSMDTMVELKITKDGYEYRYEMITPHRNLQGKANFSADGEYLLLNGIRRASWEIDENPQELPDNVDVYIDGDELVIQNYGNMMNEYVLFDDIEEKYIRLIKE